MTAAAKFFSGMSAICRRRASWQNGRKPELTCTDYVYPDADFPAGRGYKKRPREVFGIVKYHRRSMSGFLAGF